MSRILITGASGFVAQRLIPVLMADRHFLRAALRVPGTWTPPPGIEAIAVGDIGPETDWRPALEGIETVIHLAARAHVMNDRAADRETLYRRVNCEGTRRLAEQAATAGVRRLVFLGSIKVNGERTAIDTPFTETDTPAPEDAYGRSKLAAEEALHTIARETGLAVTILRSPLVYGPGVKGNFHALLDLCARGWPLPLASVRNARSLIHVGNLADALRLAAEHPAAGGETFLVGDGEAVSTPDLVRHLADALGRPARLFPVPPPALRLAGRILGRSGQVTRLLDSLVVNDGKIRQKLAWQPPFTVVEGLRETVAWFLSESRR